MALSISVLLSIVHPVMQRQDHHLKQEKDFVKNPISEPKSKKSGEIAHPYKAFG